MLILPLFYILLAVPALSRTCFNLTIPLNLSPQLAVFDLKIPVTAEEISALTYALTNPSFNITAAVLTGYTTLPPKQYNISATLCIPGASSLSSSLSSTLSSPPPPAPTAPTLLLLTHGIAFSKSYWDPPAPFANYSFVAAALAAGHATLALSRPGIAASSRADPLLALQAPLQVAALRAVAEVVRAGRLAEVAWVLLDDDEEEERHRMLGSAALRASASASTSALLPAPSEGLLPSSSQSPSQSQLPSWTFPRIALVGHSFGAILSAAVAAEAPHLADALVLTGFSLNTTYLPLFVAGAALQTARMNQPFRLGGVADARAVGAVVGAFGDGCGGGGASGGIGTGGNGGNGGAGDVGGSLPMGNGGCNGWVGGWESEGGQATDPASIVSQYGLTDLFARAPQGRMYDYPNGHMVTGNPEAGLYLLFSKTYSRAVSTYAETTKFPVTVGELLTLGGAVGGSAPSPFTGPVFIVTGSDDVPFCGGACLNNGRDLIATGTREKWPNASRIETYIQPNTGHALNLHWNATGTYNLITGWLKSSGL